MHPSLLAPPSPQHRRALLADRRPAADVDPVLLAEIAAGLAVALAADRRTGDGGLLLETRHYTAWQLVWPVGAVWDTDDADRGALHVVRGELVERWSDLLHLDHDERVVGPGDGIALGGTLTARLENRSPQPAVLVHVTTGRHQAASPRAAEVRRAS